MQQELDQIESAHVDLEAESERGEWANSVLDDFVEFGSVRPVGVVAKGIIAKNVATLAFHIRLWFCGWKLAAGAEQQYEEERLTKKSTERLDTAKKA